jgi:hypothetical protein
MSLKYETPEGYLPYRLFSYRDGQHICVLRPEQFVGLAASHEQGVAVHVHLKDSVVTMKFGAGPTADAAADRFVAALTNFLESDALRNAHNAVMRKGNKNNG